VAIFDDISATLATVPVTLGHAIQYARLTSNPAAQGSRTWTAFTVATGLIQLRSFTEEFDADRNAYTKRERAELWAPVTLILSLGDLVKDQNNVEFSVVSAAPSGIGTWTYLLARDLPGLVGPDRKGGV
jgi:hypothetical protein